jgi:putative ABC transport system permease protein
VFRYALNNLFSKRVRTLLCLVLLTMVLAGTIGLISLSSGMRSTVTTALKKLEGIAVIAKGSADPIFSTLPVSLGEKIRDLEGVSAVSPEIWGVVARLDGESPLTKGWFSAAGFGGIDPSIVEDLRGGGLYGKSVVEGRFLQRGDERTVVMSRKIAQEYGKKLHDEVEVNGVRFKIVGFYHTGSLFLDMALLIPVADARRIKGMSDTWVSAFYVETEDQSGSTLKEVAEKIEGLSKGIDAKTKHDWHKDFGSILGNLDAFFTAQSAYIAILGVVIVLLTMTMSVMERTREFGILKAVGWTRADVMRLVMLESLLLGEVSGILGCVMGVISATVLGYVLPYKPQVPVLLVLATFFGGLFIGFCGGIYPAFRASSLNPVEAIRTE